MTILAAGRGLQFQPPYQLPQPTSGSTWVVVILNVRVTVNRTVTLASDEFTLTTGGGRYVANGSATLPGAENQDFATLGAGAPTIALTPSESTNIWLAFEVPDSQPAGQLKVTGSGLMFQIDPYFTIPPGATAPPSRSSRTATPRRTPTATPRRSGSSGSSSGSANIWGWTPYHEAVVTKVCTDSGATATMCECVVDLAMLAIRGATLAALIDGSASAAEEEEFEDTLEGILVICAFSE